MIKIWDKREPINGVSAEKILSERYDLKSSEDIILIINEQGIATNIEIPSILKSNLGLNKELSALEVGEAYLNHLKEINKQTQPVQNKEQLQEDRIKSLENTILELKEVI